VTVKSDDLAIVNRLRSLSPERRDTRVGLHPLEGIVPIDGVVVALERIALDVARRPDVDAGFAACRLQLDVQRCGKLAAL
jgi:hypothetical protein